MRAALTALCIQSGLTSSKLIKFSASIFYLLNGSFDVTSFIVKGRLLYELIGCVCAGVLPQTISPHTFSTTGVFVIILL